MRNYEILTILPGTLAENEVQPVVDTMKQMIEAEGITGVTVESAGKSRLAYPIKHIRYGYFHIFTFTAEPATITKIEQKMRLFGQILRTIIRTFDPSKRNASKGTAMFTLVSTDDEKNEGAPRSLEMSGTEQKPERAPVDEMVKIPVSAPVVAPVSEEKEVETDTEAPAKKSEDKPKEMNMQEFDKQLEAILDDKIAGL